MFHYGEPLLTIYNEIWQWLSSHWLDGKFDLKVCRIQCSIGPTFNQWPEKRNEVKVIISKSWTENNSLPTSWKAPFRSGKLQNCFFFLWFSSPLQIVFTLIDTTCLQQAGWNVYINEKLRKYLSSISVSFSTFTFLMTGDNYQANVVDKTDHMWRTIFILISGGWGGHHGWKLRVSFSLSLSRWPEIMTGDNGYNIFFHG